MVKKPDSKGKDSVLEPSIKPGELYMNTNSTLIKENSLKTGLTIRVGLYQLKAKLMNSLVQHSFFVYMLTFLWDI